jgi:hypothetical protein
MALARAKVAAIQTPLALIAGADECTAAVDGNRPRRSANVRSEAVWRIRPLQRNDHEPDHPAHVEPKTQQVGREAIGREPSASTSTPCAMCEQLRPTFDPASVTAANSNGDSSDCLEPTTSLTQTHGPPR